MCWACDRITPVCKSIAIGGLRGAVPRVQNDHLECLPGVTYARMRWNPWGWERIGPCHLSGREPEVTVRASRDGVEAEMPVASIVGVRVGSEYGSAR